MRHIVITGASSGLGFALSQHYAAPGTRLTLFGRDAARLDAAAQSCKSRGADVAIFACDVTDASTMAANLATADRAHAIDIMFANAALGGADALAGPHGETEDQSHRIVSTNILGVVNTITPLIAQFALRRAGTIVIIGSMAGFEGLAQAPMYSASKAAVRTYGIGLRRLLAPSNVQVCVVSPGFITTPMSASLNIKTPFAWTADRAARHIAIGIARRRAEIIFPWQLRCAAAVANVLPASIIDRVLAATSAHPGNRE